MNRLLVSAIDDDYERERHAVQLTEILKVRVCEREESRERRE
jgi:hypothetical protein